MQLAQTEEVDNKVIADKETEISDLKEKLSLQRNEMKQLQNEMQSCKNTENQLKVKTDIILYYGYFVTIVLFLLFIMFTYSI